MTRIEGSENLYQVLGVSPRATQEEIKRRYRQLVKAMHPDCNEGRGEEVIRRINEAYEFLGKAKRRKYYDAMLLHRMENGVRSASSISDVFSYARTKQAYEAYLERIRKRKHQEDPNGL